jgi:hypothetical protein
MEYQVEHIACFMVCYGGEAGDDYYLVNSSFQYFPVIGSISHRLM